ncbi:MAG TPA: manganese ABC transporter permease, partial [Enterococcus sp.]|nr:manganese ABC transporter permease [Enterococcus sp.]
GATIVLACALFFTLAFLFSPTKGILFRSKQA